MERERAERGEAVEPTPKPKSQFVSEIGICQGPGARKNAKSPKVVQVEDLEWVEAFERDFWGEYPRKVGRLEALAAWKRMKPKTEGLRDEVCDGLDRWKRYWERAETERDYIPYPGTWLNQERWKEEP